MKYKNEITINAPREYVVALFTDPANIEKWQPGFQSMERIKGEGNEVGAQHRMRYKMGKRDIEMVETITQNALPELFAATYETKGVWNEVSNHFEELENGTTKYWTESEFKMSGMMKLFGWIMPGAFKKQSQQYLDLFKNFVEKELENQAS